MNRLVAFGCSHTYGKSLPDSAQEFFSDKKKYRKLRDSPPSKDAWPALLAKKIKLPLENLSCCGASNKQITEIILNSKLEETDFVVILWTNIYRTCFFTKDTIFQISPSYTKKKYIRRYNAQMHIERFNINNKYYKDFFWQRNLEYETLQNIDHAKRYLDSKGIQNWHFNFVRPVGPFQITSLLPNDLPKWFEVDVHTLTMIDDYGLDGMHPGLKAHANMAEQVHTTLLDYLGNIF
tara:strand:- start:16242 stop:16949 length:708 start_codon:yes stop_codon:yes gene_type:complete